MKIWNVKYQLKKGEDLQTELLGQRGVRSDIELNEFLNPPSLNEQFRRFPSDFISSLSSAKKLIYERISSGSVIVVHGDYDADGICATAILFQAINTDLKHPYTQYFIPNRFDHGYGISKKSVDEVILRNPGKKILFITVDSGISANESAQYIKSLGHDLIITDHHQRPSELPVADVIVWNDSVVGASVAWFLSRVLGSRDDRTIQLAALATITDLQPVLGINRSIVKLGLLALNTNPILGLKKLLDVAQRGVGDLTTYDLGWVLGPRLNASGRLTEAKSALELLLEEDPLKAMSLASELDKINSQRQDKTSEMYEFAKDIREDALPKVIVSVSDAYHEGIIGLVAARISQKYNRPAIVIALNGEYGKGSVRSVSGIDIITFLRKFDDLFVNLGGHPMAAGFTIASENIDALRQKIAAAADTYIADDKLIPVLNIDMEIPFGLITEETVSKLEILKPFGLGNEEPIFLGKGAGLLDITPIGKENQHSKLKLYADDRFFTGILFGREVESINSLLKQDVDVAYQIKQKVYNGKKYIDLILKDIRPAQSK
jgi:single-stranded-DNA-specific exonuclease